MQESLLHHLWQFQYFDHNALITSDGQAVTVFNPGRRNSHSGPDFSDARIRIGEIEWIGNVEIHIHASGWTDHKHDHDPAYENVILHVVWKNDLPVTRKDFTLLPTIELQGRVEEKLLLRYNSLILNPESVPCAGLMGTVDRMLRLSMVEKALVDRLEQKSEAIMRLLGSNNNDWEETTYQMLAKNFGFKVNADPFLNLARSLPYRMIMKHADQQLQVEALLFGQAGMLEDQAQDEYFTLLKREYALLSNKFGLDSKRLNKVQWKFLRLRPANFPTIRIAQLAALLSLQRNIFSWLVRGTTFRELASLLSVTQSAYWTHHYLFDKFIKEEISPLGKSSVENIVINTVVPLIVAYGRSQDDPVMVEKGLMLLQQIPPEQNNVLRKWRDLNVIAQNAFESQGLIGLYNNFCLRRRCLDCKIGSSLIKPK